MCAIYDDVLATLAIPMPRPTTADRWSLVTSSCGIDPAEAFLFARNECKSGRYCYARLLAEECQLVALKSQVAARANHENTKKLSMACVSIQSLETLTRCCVLSICMSLPSWGTGVLLARASSRDHTPLQHHSTGSDWPTLYA